MPDTGFLNTAVMTLFAMMVTTAFAEERLSPVKVARATMLPIYREVPLSGSVMARRVSLLSPKVNGIVDEVYADDGDSVKKADILMRLDNTLAKMEMARDAAASEEAAARLEEAIRQRDEAAILVKKKHVSNTAYLAASAEVKMNRAVLKRLQAQLRHQQETVHRHTVKAPFDGVIGKKLVEIGQWVETGDGVFELVEVDKLRIDVPVPQRYFSLITLGTPVTVQFDALPEKTFDAAVTSTIPVGSDAARTFSMRIDMDNLNRSVAPGMSARVNFLLKPENDIEESMVLPRDAVVKSPNGDERVWLVKEEENVLRVESVAVKTGRSYKEFVELIKGGIKVGDRIVVRGNEILEQGQKIRIVSDL